MSTIPRKEEALASPLVVRVAAVLVVCGVSAFGQSSASRVSAANARSDSAAWFCMVRGQLLPCASNPGIGNGVLGGLANSDIDARSLEPTLEADTSATAPGELLLPFRRESASPNFALVAGLARERSTSGFSSRVDAPGGASRSVTAGPSVGTHSVSEPVPDQFIDVWQGGSGNWSDFSNWSCLCVPNGSGVDVNIGVGPGPPPLNGTVLLDVPASVDLVDLGNLASGTLNLTSAKNTLTTIVTYVGFSGQGTLNISGGGIATDTGDGEVGVLSGSTGTVTVSGSGSQWINSGTLEIAPQGHATVSISNGGVFTSNNAIVGQFSGSSGSVIVSGSGSQWSDSGNITIGSGGQGTLTLQAGATGSSASVDVGANSGSTGTVTLTDAGTTWTNSAGQVTVGDAGTGTLTVKNGGVFTNSGDLVLGNQGGGSGTLTISGAGQVSNVHGFIGIAAGSTGTVTVDGAGSQWTNASELAVGYFGQGVLSIENGGLVTSAGGSQYFRALFESNFGHGQNLIGTEPSPVRMNAAQNIGGRSPNCAK